MRLTLMKRRFFRRSLLVITFGLIWFSLLMGVLSPEFSSAPKNIITGDSEWRLLVDGLVNRPLSPTFNELVAMPRSTMDALGMKVSDSDKSFLEVKSNKTGILKTIDWLFSMYAPYVIAAAATALVVYSISFLKRRKNRCAHINE